MTKFFKMRDEDHALFKEIAKKESRSLINQFHIMVEKYNFYKMIVLPE